MKLYVTGLVLGFIIGAVIMSALCASRIDEMLHVLAETELRCEWPGPPTFSPPTLSTL